MADTIKEWDVIIRIMNVLCHHITMNKFLTFIYIYIKIVNMYKANFRSKQTYVYHCANCMIRVFMLLCPFIGSSVKLVLLITSGYLNMQVICADNIPLIQGLTGLRKWFSAILKLIATYYEPFLGRLINIHFYLLFPT